MMMKTDLTFRPIRGVRGGPGTNRVQLLYGGTYGGSKLFFEKAGFPL